MAWRIEVAQAAVKDLDRLDRPVARRIAAFLADRLAILDDPRGLGEALKGTTLGQLWRYRVGDYRIIADIQDDRVRILVVRIGNRRDVYRR